MSCREMCTLKISLGVVTQVSHDDSALSGDASDAQEMNIAVRVTHLRVDVDILYGSGEAIIIILYSKL